MKKQLSSPEPESEDSSPRRPRKRDRSVLYTEIPRELRKTLKMICLQKDLHVSVWVRQQIVSAVEREAKALGIVEDLRFLTGAARLREAGRGLRGLEGEKPNKEKGEKS